MRGCFYEQMNHQDTRGFSPRMRGCFPEVSNRKRKKPVLPAYAGMFPWFVVASVMTTCSPRVCGDVSSLSSSWTENEEFSPRMRGCFRSKTDRGICVEVLPAYAGMFLPSVMSAIISARSPRVCGDVSETIISINIGHVFSPRMRGCFRHIPRNARGIEVLPAYAGMFPGASESLSQDSRSPRVCGDVSLAAR